LNQFEAAKKAMIDASASVADQAVDVAHDMSTRAFKLSLDVRVKAPVLVIPESSTSNLAIVLDLGQLSVKNKFERPEGGMKSPDGQPAVIDELTADLANCVICRY
jgi:vacuolar protein sorting-associated protein 13A/C